MRFSARGACLLTRKAIKTRVNDSSFGEDHPIHGKKAKRF